MICISNIMNNYKTDLCSHKNIYISHIYNSQWKVRCLQEFLLHL